jgi:uncharacterized membrane protein YuzA (DUF378 family)
MKAEKILCMIALILVIIGAVNWGASALKFNLVSKTVGSGDENNKNKYENAVYILVALAGVYVAVQLALGKIVCQE